MLSSALQRQLATAHISSLFVLLLATTIVAQGFLSWVSPETEVATNITFLAPNNDAFTKLLTSSSPDTSLVEALFSYHTLIGVYKSTDPHSAPSFIPRTLYDSEYTTLEGEQVVEAAIRPIEPQSSRDFYRSPLQQRLDIQFSGGIIHVVDAFLTIPPNLSTTLDVLNLTACLGAVEAAPGLSSAIDLSSVLTMFVPDNAAFQAVGTTLNSMSGDQLAKIMDFHIASNYVSYSPFLNNGDLVGTQDNADLSITKEGGQTFINSAALVVSDVLVLNDVSDIIKVLNPSDTTKSPNPSATPPVPEFARSPLAGGEVPLASGILTPSITISTPALLLAAASGSASNTIPITGSPSTAPTASGSSPSSGSTSGSSGLSSGAKAGIGTDKSRSKGEIPYPEAAEISPPEKDLAAELATRRDHAAELPADVATREPLPAKNVVAETGVAPGTAEQDITMSGGQELDGKTVGPELDGQHPAVQSKPRPRAETGGLFVV